MENFPIFDSSPVMKKSMAIAVETKTRWEGLPKDLFTLVLEAQKGVYANAAFEIADELLIPQEDIAGILHLSAKTLRNYQQEKKKLAPTTSEQVLKLEVLAGRGLEVFGDRKALLRWLRKPSYGLEGQIPFDLLRTSGGIDLIIEELDRIAYGDFS